MKHGGDYARRLRHLFNRLIRKYGKPAPCEPSDPLTQMLIAILGGNTSHHKALAAFRKLREQMVDLNELRVTPVNELARTLSQLVPQPEIKAQRIIQVLNDIRRRHDTLDLSFLKQRGRREAREYLESLEGVDRATAASVTLFSLGGHAIPIDELRLAILRKEGVVDPAADLAEVQSFVERHIAASEAMAFAQLLDRHTASRSVRLPEGRPEEAGERTLVGAAVPSAQPSDDEPAAASSGTAGQASRRQEMKGRSAGANDCRPRAKASNSRSSPRSAEHRRKPSPRHKAAKTGKTGRRR